MIWSEDGNNENKQNLKDKKNFDFFVLFIGKELHILQKDVLPSDFNLNKKKLSGISRTISLNYLLCYDHACLSASY